MRREEAIKILTSIKAKYPYFNKDVVDLNPLVNIWEICFEDYPYQAVSFALIKYIKTNTGGFAPEPAHLIELILQVDTLTEMEAWIPIEKAICGRMTKDEWDLLPSQVTSQFSWQEIKRLGQTENLNLEVVQSNFMRSYKQKVKTVKEQLAIGVSFNPKQIGG